VLPHHLVKFKSTCATVQMSYSIFTRDSTMLRAS